MIISSEMLKIKTEAKEKWKNIFAVKKDKWVQIYGYLKKNGNFDFYNGKCSLVEVSTNGLECEAIFVYNEQGFDFLIVFDRLEDDERRKNLSLYFYSFEHYYDEDENDSSLLEKILKEEKSVDKYEPIYHINYAVFKSDNVVHDLSGSLRDIYSYINLYYLDRTLSTIMYEVDPDSEKKDTDVSTYKFETEISKMIDHVFKEKKHDIISFYQKLKTSGEVFEEYGTECFVKKIKTKKQEDFDFEDETDDIFLKHFGIGKQEKTSEQIEEGSYRDALVLKRDDSQFVFVFHDLEDNEYEETQKIDLHYCSVEDKNYSTLETLFNDYKNIDNRPIYKIDYDDFKGLGKPNDYSGDTKNLYYFALFERLFSELESNMLAMEN